MATTDTGQTGLLDELGDMTRDQLIETVIRGEWQQELMHESLAELEMALDSDGWRKLDASFSGEFSRDALDRIIRRSRYAYLANPLINHALEVQAHYVVGQGVDVAARHPAINDVLRALWEDPGNRGELTSDTAMQLADIELSATGNIFLTLFVDEQTGRVRVRSIAVEEVRAVVTNPEDLREPRYYRREWMQPAEDGHGMPQRMAALYPHWRYRPPRAQRPDRIGDTPVIWGARVMHVKVGGIGKMRFGVPETYSALDWAVAVREDLERFATIRRAQAAFATRITTAGGRKGVAAAKARLATTIGAPGGETNAPPISGSTFLGSQGGADYDLVRMSGAAPHPDDAKRLGLMVAAGTGIPETMLFGNADVGNLATSKTLDRPTELKMIARQRLWHGVINDLCGLAIDEAVRAPKGALRQWGSVERDATGAEVIVMRPDPASRTPNDPIDRTPIVTFPSILDRDVQVRVGAIATAARLLPESARELVARLLLAALDVDDIDAVLDELYPPDDDGAADDDADWPPADDAPRLPAMPDTDALFLSAVRNLNDLMVEMREGRG